VHELAVELDQLNIEVGADGSYGVLADGQHCAGAGPAPVVGHKHQVRVHQ
jgi:hypothetical protein